MILAAGVAWGVHTWLAYRTTQIAQTATLSWDAAVARRMDPGLTDAAEPAVATAQSMLSDSVVASLAQSASLTLTAGPARVGEFRSRLELQQPSANVLQVGFRDPSPQHAAQTANVVARALAAGAPAPAAAPATPASEPAAPASVAPAPAVQSAAPAAKTPASADADKDEGTLGHSLSQLEAELAATQSKVESLNTSAAQRREHPELSSYRESKEQQLLTAQVSAALKEVADLRANPANGAGAQEPLREIQDALRSVWPASRADKTARNAADHSGFNAAGVDAGRLRLERTEFARAVEIVQKEQRAAERLESAQPSKPAAQAPPAEPTAPPATTQSAAAAAAASPSTAPIAESEIPRPPAEEPFQLLRAAGTPVRNPLWPAVVAGACCGLLYLVIAGSRYPREEEEYTEEGGDEPQRMITPARPRNFFESPGPPSTDDSQDAEPRSAPLAERPEPQSKETAANPEPGPTDSLDSAADSHRRITPAGPPRPASFFESSEPQPKAASPEPPPTDSSEGAADSHRMITPSRPLRPASFFENSEPQPKEASPNPDPRSRDLVESAADSQRLTTSARPLRSASFFEGPEPQPGEASPNPAPRSTGFFEGAADSRRMMGSPRPLRSASFFERSEARSKDTAATAEPRSSEFLGSAHSTRPVEPVGLRPSEIIPPPPQIDLPRPRTEAPELSGAFREETSSDVGVQETATDADETKRPFQEKVAGEDGDPWVDNIMKTLSETSIGRMYEPTAPAEGEAGREENHGAPLSIHPDRLAG